MLGTQGVRNNLIVTQPIIYQNANQTKDSVHLQDWPKRGKKDEKLIAQMKFTQEIVSKGLKERDIAKIGLKWPLQKVVIYGKQKEIFHAHLPREMIRTHPHLAS